MEGQLIASARLEEGIPKLLVKVSPATAANGTKNLGEVTLRKLGSSGRSHVAVVHLSAAVPVGIVLISTKLAELLGVSNGEQVQINRSERVSRRGSKEDGSEAFTSAVRSQSKHGGSLPPEPQRMSMTWSESPVFAQGRHENTQRRTVHGVHGSLHGGARIMGTPQARVAEDLPEHLQTPPRHGYMPTRTMASVASAQGFHHPPMPVAMASPKGFSQPSPKTPMQSPATPGYHPVYPQSHAHPRAAHAQSASPKVAMRMTQVPQPTNFAFHLARPKASPKVHSARTSTGATFMGYRRSGSDSQAEAADWLPQTLGSTWHATQRQVPPSSPPALVPKARQAESRSPSPPHTPAQSPPQVQKPQPFNRADSFPAPSAFFPAAPFERSVSDGADRTSPSPPLLPRRVDPAAFSPHCGPKAMPHTAPTAAPRVERRFSLPAESQSHFNVQDLAAAMAPVPSDRPMPSSTSAWPLNPPPLKVAAMVAPPPPKSLQKAGPPPATVQEVEPPPPVNVQNVHKAEPPPASVQIAEPTTAAKVEAEQGHALPQASEEEDAEMPKVQHASSYRRASKLALVPIGQRGEGRGLRTRNVSLGALQCESNGITNCPPVEPLNDSWLPPNKSAGGSLERSELGGEITTEVRRWLKGQTSGLQCSHVVMDKALTVLSNFKLSSGCELEVLGGPLGAIIGGYNEEDWLYQEIFSKNPGQALQDAFQLLGFPSDGDWSGYMVEEISLAYRRQCLRGHPSRGGSSQHYLKLQVAMELIRAFDQESCTDDGHEEEAAAWSPMTRRKRKVHGFVLDDLALVRELELSQTEAALEADTLPAERLEELNRALDEYILRQMCFKSEIVAEIARLHENSAYSILGVSPEASDAEIKKAYRLVAMQCHPDKGGDKAEFQELHEAYEKIMEQRRSSANLAKSGGPTESSPQADPAPNREEEKEPEEVDEEVDEEEEPEEKHESEHEDEDGGRAAQLLTKSGKAAEEASRYAKTAADFAHQAAEAAETARVGRDGGNALALTKSIAHSAIVLTLTVVKAVRVVGYATMDVAAQCRLAARKFSNSSECAECSTEAMGLGLEALNAALSCAEVTEVTAAELSRELSAQEDEQLAAERFIAAAVRASLAAASASNAAMSAAIAAVEGNRQCIQAAQPAEEPKDPKPREEAEEENSEKSDDETARSEQSERKAAESESPEEQGLKRQINQRNNNHKVLLRLNAEILLHQQNVRQFLQANRQLIPEVSCEAKGKVQTLLRDYAHEVQLELQGLSGDQLEELPSTLKHSGLLAPLLQRQVLAIPVCPKARVLKMAALYDLQMTFQVLDQEIFEPARQMLLQAHVSVKSLEEVTERIHKELRGYTDGGWE